MTRITAIIAAVAVVLTASGFAAAQQTPADIAPTSAVRFPAGYTGKINVGETKVWPTTPPIGAPQRRRTTAAAPRAGHDDDGADGADDADDDGDDASRGPGEDPGPDVAELDAAVPRRPAVSVPTVGRHRCVPHHDPLLHFGYADPIVYPGSRGVAHLHAFFGNSDTATTTDPTSCSSTASDGGTLNKSATGCRP